MAYFLRFKTITGSDIRIDIGGTGGTELIGAADPFVTQEQTGGDMFTPVRTQTGYIRVVDDGDLMGTIIPNNNTTTKVMVTGGGGWEGFLCADGYSQPWEGGKKIIELPVKSVLAALYDATINTNNVEQLVALGDIINEGLTALGYSSHGYSTNDDCNGAWASAKVNASVFFSKETISNQGDRSTAYFGKSYGEIIEDICRLFGLTCRDTGTGIVFATYDRPTGFAIGVITSVFNFRGTGHTQGFITGGRDAVVSLSFDNAVAELASLPFATEDSSTVLTIQDVVNGTAKVQPHERSNSSVEMFFYNHYSTRGSAVSQGTYQDCLNNSVIGTPILPAIYDDPTIETGAFPVRYSFNPTDDNTLKILANGLMLNINPIMVYNASVPSNINNAYILQSESSITRQGGYLNIEMAVSCFMETNAVQANKKLQYGIQNYYYTRNFRMFLMLQWGGKFWNGTEWTDNASIFDVVTDGAQLMTNLGENSMSTKGDGYFVPVSDLMSGIITLSIMDSGAFQITYPNDQKETFQVHSSIISKLNLLYVETVNQTSSERNKNVYRESILSAGFNESKETELAIGTMNNNYPSPVFIKSDNTTFIETILYSNGTSQRPEMHLLGRMVAYYGKVRRTMRATVGTGLDLFGELYSHGGHVFVGIDAQHNWRDDTQEVEFIEVRDA